VANKPPPERPVVMGRIVAPYGIRGWIKVKPYTAELQGLTGYRAWWVGNESGWQEHAGEQARVHAGAVVAKLAACEDREAAAAMRGLDIAIPRTALPEAGPGEYYWIDLLGLRVENEQAQRLGVVSEIVRTGANDVLVVEGDRERLIPLIADVVKRVELEDGLIVVDWGIDY
jgi:16S rRNA processing protein RimM